MSVLNDLINHRGICISHKPESTGLPGLPVLHYHGINNITIFTEMFDELRCIGERFQSQAQKRLKPIHDTRLTKINKYQRINTL